MGCSVFDMTIHVLYPEQIVPHEEADDVSYPDPPEYDPQTRRGGYEIAFCGARWNEIMQEDGEAFLDYLCAYDATVRYIVPWAGDVWIIEFPPETPLREVVWFKLRWA